jgi:hypothetical protein
MTVRIPISVPPLWGRYRWTDVPAWTPFDRVGHGDKQAPAWPSAIHSVRSGTPATIRPGRCGARCGLHASCGARPRQSPRRPFRRRRSTDEMLEPETPQHLASTTSRTPGYHRSTGQSSSLIGHGRSRHPLEPPTGIEHRRPALRCPAADRRASQNGRLSGQAMSGLAGCE